MQRQSGSEVTTITSVVIDEAGLKLAQQVVQAKYVEGREFLKNQQPERAQVSFKKALNYFESGREAYLADEICLSTFILLHASDLEVDLRKLMVSHLAHADELLEKVFLKLSKLVADFYHLNPLAGFLVVVRLIVSFACLIKAFPDLRAVRAPLLSFTNEILDQLRQRKDYPLSKEDEKQLAGAGQCIQEVLILSAQDELSKNISDIPLLTEDKRSINFDYHFLKGYRHFHKREYELAQGYFVQAGREFLQMAAKNIILVIKRDRYVLSSYFVLETMLNRVIENPNDKNLKKGAEALFLEACERIKKRSDPFCSPDVLQVWTIFYLAKIVLKYSLLKKELPTYLAAIQSEEKVVKKAINRLSKERAESERFSITYLGYLQKLSMLLKTSTETGLKEAVQYIDQVIEKNNLLEAVYQNISQLSSVKKKNKKTKGKSTASEESKALVSVEQSKAKTATSCEAGAVLPPKETQLILFQPEDALNQTSAPDAARCAQGLSQYTLFKAPLEGCLKAAEDLVEESKLTPEQKEIARLRAELAAEQLQAKKLTEELNAERQRSSMLEAQVALLEKRVQQPKLFWDPRTNMLYKVGVKTQMAKR